MIVHYRIEDKFIHGVTTTHVFAHHPCDGIIIIDDAVLEDKQFRNLLKLTLPEQVLLYFFGTLRAPEHIQRAEQSELNYYMIVRNPLTAVQLQRQGYRFKGPITCGQQPTRENSIPIMNGVSLTEEEIDAFDALEAAGCEVVLDPGGTDENIPWRRAKKAVQAATQKRIRANESNKNTSLAKTLNILDCFLQGAPGGLSLSEIQQQTKIPFSTCYRLVDFLEENGYLTKGKNMKKYSLGWKLLTLAASYENAQLDILFEELAPPYLRALQEEFNETACIYVRVGSKMKCIVIAPSSHLLQARPRLNRLWEIEQNSTGYVLAAHMPKGKWLELFGKSAQVEPLLRQAAKDGYSVSTQNGSEGVSSVSAQIIGQDGELYGALTLQGPTFRFMDDQLVAKTERTIEIAQKLSHDMQQALLLRD